MYKLKTAFKELENFYVGFVFNPIVSLNNVCVDKINAWTDKLKDFNEACRDPLAYGVKTGQIKVLELEENEHGGLVMKGENKEFPVRPVQSKEDLEVVLKHEIDLN